MARPISTSYSVEAQREIVDHVLAQVACGRSVARIMFEDEGMPHVATFWTWVRSNPQLDADLRRAREHGIEVHLEQAIDIVDDATDDAYIDWVGTGENRTPVAKIDGKAIRRASLQYEARVKLAQMLKPKTYGAKLDLTSAGEKLEGSTQLNDNRLQAIVGLVAQRKQQAKIAETLDQQPKEPDDEDVDPLS